MKKIINFIMCIALVVIVSVLPCFASTSGFDLNSYSAFSPNAVIFHSHDDVFVSNNQMYNTLETTEIYSDNYTIYVNDYGNGELNYETVDFSFDALTLDYGSFYTDIYIGPFLKEDITIGLYDNVDINAFVYYTVTYYLGDGSKMDISRTDNYSSTDGYIDIDIRSYAEQEKGRNGFISSFVVHLDFSDDIKEVSVTQYAAGDYGISLGNRIFSNIEVTQNVINPNILDWLTDSLDAFMSARIFGDITIGAILAFVVAVPMVTWFLKLVAGG